VHINQEEREVRAGIQKAGAGRKSSLADIDAKLLYDNTSLQIIYLKGSYELTWLWKE